MNIKYLSPYTTVRYHSDLNTLRRVRSSGTTRNQVVSRNFSRKGQAEALKNHKKILLTYLFFRLFKHLIYLNYSEKKSSTVLSSYLLPIILFLPNIYQYPKKSRKGPFLPLPPDTHVVSISIINLDKFNRVNFDDVSDDS